MQNIPVGFVQDDLYNIDCCCLIASLDDYVCSKPHMFSEDLVLLGRNGFYESSLYEQYSWGQDPEFLRDSEGKIRKVLLKYMPRACEDDVASCDGVDVCGPADPGVGYEDADVDWNPICSYFNFKMSHNELQKSCLPDGDSSFFQQQVMRLAQPATVKLEKDLLALLIAGAGATIDSDTGLPVAAPTPVAIPAFLGANGTVNAPALRKLICDFDENLLGNDCPPVAFFGKRNAIGWMDTLQQIGCCNQDGIDQGRLSQIAGSGMLPYKSRTVEAAFAQAGIANPQNQALVFAPGNFHLLWNHPYEGANQIDLDTQKATTWIDPRYGVKWNMVATYECLGMWSFHFWVEVTPWIMPATDNCDKAGLNGLHLFDIQECPVAGCGEAQVQQVVEQQVVEQTKTA